MKKTIYGLLILTFIMMVSCAIAQNETGFDTSYNKTKKEIMKLDNLNIKLDLSITIDNKTINDTSFVLTIVNRTTNYITHIKVSNKFILFLDYDTIFDVSLSYEGTNMKTIIVDTNAPEDNWYIISGINLSKVDKHNIIAGGIKYDKELQTFKKYKII